MPESGRVYRWERQTIISVDETATQVEVEVFPNPVNSLLSLTADLNIDLIQITDMLGKVVLESALQCKNCQIQTEDLATGIYLVKIKIGDQVISKKITKS